MENTKINQPIQNHQDLLKLCRKCKQTFPATLDYFYKHPGGKYGLTPRCKPCVTEDNKKWSEANPERVKFNQNKRSAKYYYSDIERGRAIARESAAKAIKDPVKKLKIQSRKRAGGAGLTPEEIEAIRSEQNNKCAICDEPEPTDLDHCHISGRVRWLLCKHCNRGLGAFRDRSDLLRKAADLLDKITYNKFVRVHQPDPYKRGFTPK